MNRRRLKDYPVLLQHIFGMHNAFRNLGFNAGDIYVEPALNEHRVPVVFVTLKFQGIDFKSCAGFQGDLTVEQIQELWTDLVEKHNKKMFLRDEEALTKKVVDTYGGLPQLILALARKGIHLRVVPKGAN